MKHGFSLVELAIVLVILGLLTGGMLAGKSLIRASEMRAVPTEYARYSQAMRAFQDRYFYFPGDMPNAIKVWGAQVGGTADGFDATCIALDSTSPATGIATCNGNGDGYVSTAGSQKSEHFRAWQQMANAGLIEGSFVGVPGANGVYDGVIGWNLPASRMSNGGWSIYSWTISAHAYWFDHPQRIFLTFGAESAGNAYVQDGILNPDEAWNIDTKMDDGVPGTGRIHAHKSTSSYTPNCTTSADPAVSQYNITTTNKCSFLFFL